MKFKIDYSKYDAMRVAVYRKLIFWDKWNFCQEFKTMEEARDFITNLKKLPEYH